MRAGVLLVLSSILYFSCEPAIPETEASFDITIENLSSGESATRLSPGVYLTKKSGFPLFFNGAQDFGTGLADIAGDGNNSVLAESLSNNPYVLESGTFGPINPGSSTTFSVTATYGTFINFATMFVESNDLFYSFDDDGIHLFEPNGDPVSEDVTRLVWLWDVGDEQNQEPYIGSFQPPRQAFLGEGETELRTVRLVDDGFSYPPKFSVIRVTISPVSR